MHTSLAPGIMDTSTSTKHQHQLEQAVAAGRAAKGVPLADCGSRLADLHQLAMAKGAWLAAKSLVGRPRLHASTTSHTQTSRNVELVVWALDRDVAESGHTSKLFPACPTY